MKTHVTRRWTRWSMVALAIFAFAVSPIISQEYETVTVKQGDTLWGLAVRFLGSGYMYQQFVPINTFRSGNPGRIYPGEVLNIPGTSKAPEPVVVVVQPEPEPEPEPVEIEIPVSVLEQMLTAMNMKLAAMSADLDSIKSRLSGVESGLNGLQSDVQSRSAAPVINLDAIETRLRTLDTSVSTLITTEIKSVRSSQEATAAEVKTLKGELAFLTQSVEAQAAIQKKALEELNAKLAPQEPMEAADIAKKRSTAGLIAVLATGIAYIAVSATR